MNGEKEEKQNQISWIETIEDEAIIQQIPQWSLMSKSINKTN